MNISPELWRQIDPLLTDALDMDDVARAAWLQNLDQTHPQLSPLVRKMLAAHDRAERSQELETVPRLASSPPTSSAFTAGQRVGPFSLVRVLGRGGMGEVWLANQADGRIERDVALKLPTVYLHSDVWRERLRRERDILAKLTHPNIAKLFDAGVSDEEGSRGQPYLALECIEGDSLIEFAKKGKLPITERLKLFQQILAAVAHAHHHLVVHRDLKPANILIDQSGQVKLLDFGIAKLIDDGADANAAADLTQMGGRIMTLRYAAPEQVADGVISTGTDVYALGVILHELVTGLSPYRAVREGRAFKEAALLGEEIAVPSSLAMTVAAANERRLATARLLSRQVGGDLDAILLKAMRRNPANRYASVEQFDDDIQRHLESRPVKAREGTWRYLASRTFARHKLPIAAAAAVLLTMIAGLVLVEQQRRIVVAEKARAEKHFASVRQLANAFVFDVDREIEHLAGALKARQSLVATALNYLDSLASESDKDPKLAAELAAAYRRIADIQGGPMAASLGMMSDSLANYEKSKVLFVALGDRLSLDISVQREHRALRTTLARAYALRLDGRWRENMAAAVQLAELVAAMNGTGLPDRVLVAGLLAEQANLTHLNDPHLTESGTVMTPEKQITKAIGLIEALAQEFPMDLTVQEQLASIYDRAASIFSGDERTPAKVATGIEFRKKSNAQRAKLVQNYPDNTQYAGSLALGTGLLARLLEKSGQYVEAEEAISTALRMIRKVVSKDEKTRLTACSSSPDSLCIPRFLIGKALLKRRSD
ncbi:MAG: serine/threonine protein kinase [Betaproteobacteria bacterium]|nr:serine/threonine protein kinase [Betaproteobacteria bacterium]